MKFLAKLKEWSMKGFSLFREAFEYVAAFIVAIVAAPFSKEEKLPTADEVNIEYINKTERDDIKKDLLERLSQPDIEAMLTQAESYIDGLETMQINQEKSYIDVFTDIIFKDSNINIDEESNILIELPDKNYKNKTKGDLCIGTTLKFDKNGKFIEGFKDYYNLNTKFKKTFDVNIKDIDPLKIELMLKVCSVINKNKVQENSTFEARGYAECIKQHFKENSLTKEKIEHALELMNIKIDENGNIISNNKNNRFAAPAVSQMISAIRNEYDIDEGKKFLDEFTKKTEVLAVKIEKEKTDKTEKEKVSKENDDNEKKETKNDVIDEDVIIEESDEISFYEKEDDIEIIDDFDTER